MLNSVYIISLGPGDPDLLTLKGINILRSADFIYCPGTTQKIATTLASRAKDIVLATQLIDESKIILFDVPMNKGRVDAINVYYNIANDVAEQFNKNKLIAIAVEGDSGFYSSVSYIDKFLRRLNIPTKHIAGIPAFIACGALANLHIVKQEERMVVIPGIISYEELCIVKNDNDVVVVMKTSQCENAIKQLIQDEKNILIHYFENVGVVNKEYYTINKKEIMLRKFPYFSLIIIQK